VGPRYPHVPEYIALSYTWGAPEENTANEVNPPLRGILVNGRRLLVGSNLYDCLFELRRRMSFLRRRSAYIWIDAICIDQSNIRERGLQIGLMGSIYRNASKVNVWLGKADRLYLRVVKPMVAGTTQLIKDFKAEYGSTETAGTNYVAHWQAEKDHTERFRKDGLPDPADARWTPFWQLFTRRWFQRAWGKSDLRER